MTQMIIKLPMKSLRKDVEERQQPKIRGIVVIKRAEIQERRAMLPEVHPEPQPERKELRMGLMVDKAGALALLGGTE